MTVRLAEIDLFPIKSFDPVTVEQACILPSGILEQDRRFALFDAEGNLINGKRTPLVHALRMTFDRSFERVTIAARRENENGESYSLTQDTKAIERRLSQHFGVDVRLREDRVAGFPDDTLASGPTIISQETLEAVADWFGLTFEDAKLRFRPNLIIAGGGPFWEDRLFAAPGESVTFHIGDVHFFGMNPCARCVVPSRDPRSGEQIRGFAKHFAERRRETLPQWASPDAFDHTYRLAVNTRLFAPAEGGALRVGDSIEMEAT